jgi:general secretion pathway protein A
LPAARVASAAAAVASGAAAGSASPVPQAAMAEVLAAALAPEGDALRELVRSWRAALDPGEACAQAAAVGLACHRSRAGLAALRQLDRPAVLALNGPQGGAVHALLVGLGETTATLQVGERRWRVALPALAGAWRGGFVTFWRPPPGWRAGAESMPAPARAWVRQQLAVAGLGDEQRPLRERVWAFQVASGLEPDGLAGPLTLMQLARVGPSDEPRLSTAAKD